MQYMCWEHILWLPIVFGAKIFGAPLNTISHVLRGGGQGFTNAVGLLLMRIRSRRLNGPNGLLAVAFDLLRSAFIGQAVIVGSFTDRLLHFSCDFVVLSTDGFFSSCAHERSPVPSFRSDSKLKRLG